MSVTSAHDLFGVDPAEFVAARDALARELKAQGRRDEAAAVKGLRRPSVPTWALNRVARDHPDVVSALLTAAASARSTQERAIEGGADGDALRGALADRRAAVRDVSARAIEVVEASGRSGAGQQRQLESTLTAVIASDHLSELLRAGELVEAAGDEPDDDLASLLSASVPARAPSRKAPPKVKPKLTVVEQETSAAPASDATKRLAERRREVAREVAKAERTVEKTRAALDAARRSADAARAKEVEAERAHDAAAAALEAARTSLDAADV